jgi:hypothetical protein
MAASTVAIATHKSLNTKTCIFFVKHVAHKKQ